MESSTTAPQPSPSTSTTGSSYYCSPGICTSYCLQFCTAANSGYFFGPPPPLFTVGDDSSSSGGGNGVSPLMIALICVLAAAFLLLSYYTFAYKYCKRRRSRWSRNDAVEDDLQTRLDQLVLQDASSVQIAAPAVNSNGGLDERFIRSIPVFKYKTGDGLVESTDCAVCLTEFKDGESLRLMPNCQHAFHLPCIDPWLRSHSSCPICRVSMIDGPPPLPPPPVASRTRGQGRRDGPPPLPPRPAPSVASRMRVETRRDVVVVVDRGLDRMEPVTEGRDVELTEVNDEKESGRGRSNH